jgi:hypothetical protein
MNVPEIEFDWDERISATWLVTAFSRKKRSKSSSMIQ